MLSKVLTGRDTARAQPIVFSTPGGAWADGASTGPPRSQPGRDNSAPGEENHALREKIRHLEAEAAAAKRDSFEAGRQHGDRQARTELAPVVERLNASLAEVIDMRHQIRMRAEKDVVELSLLIAKRVLHRELTVDSSALTALARVIFERLTRAESYLVVVHPQFAQAVSAALRGSQTGQVRIEPDPDCAPGTLIVRTEDGLIDASIDAQLHEISRGLTDHLAPPENSRQGHL
jgi:flagellar biosynthesis/type III secretory pathway protein FliH